MPRKASSKTLSPLAAHRQRLRERGLQRLEIQVHGEDAALLRAVATALADPLRSAETRALLQRIVPTPTCSLKELLASAPLEGVDLDRPRDTGRAVDL